MWKNKLTLMVIPDKQGDPKQLRIPVALIYSTIAGVLILAVASLVLSIVFIDQKVSEKELHQLRSENQDLKGKFEELRWNLAEVEDRYQDLVEREIKIRSLFGVPEIDPEERQLGVGGPVSPAIANMSPAEKTAFVTEKQLDRLLKLSEFEVEKYTEVESELESIADRLAHTPSIWPTKGWMSRGYGMKYDPFTGVKQMHRGVDIANHNGTPVVAPANGVVKYIGKNGALGKTVVINHGYGFQTRYGHLSEYKVRSGQRVKRGDIIALVGSTGHSTGPHLHYEISRNGQFLNPMKFVLNDLN